MEQSVVDLGNFAHVEKLYQWRRQLFEVERFRDRLTWKREHCDSDHLLAMKRL